GRIGRAAARSLAVAIRRGRPGGARLPRPAGVAGRRRPAAAARPAPRRLREACPPGALGGRRCERRPLGPRGGGRRVHVGRPVSGRESPPVSPTHLLMVGGASLTPIAVWLMSLEGGEGGQPAIPGWVFAGTALVGLSTFQLEYDMGIPQWQMLFHPALLAGAAAIGLVAARAAMGRGGALLAALVFIVMR